MDEPYFHQSNREKARRILSLVDSRNQIAISSSQALILSVIGGFPADNGCYLTLEGIQKRLPGKKPTLKTLRGHLAWLTRIGAIVVTEEGGKIVRRLGTPSSGVCESLRDFRVRNHTPGYGYAQQVPNMEPEMEDTGDDFNAREGKVFPSPRESFSQEDSQKDAESFAKEWESFSRDEGKFFPEQGKVFPDSTNRTEKNNKNDNFKEEIKKGNTPLISPLLSAKDELTGEPLTKKTRTRQPKNQRERRAIAVQQYDNGHVVNPLGKPNTKGRRLSPGRTRPIGTDGAVTIAQLWAGYLDIFEEAFGDKNLLESQLAGTRENISRYFDEMRQKFQDVAGYLASNRDLYEYLKYFHDPKRLQGLMKAGKYTGNIGYVHPNQVLGKVHIRRYYDQVLAARSRPTIMSENVARYQHMSNFVREAFDEIRAAWDSKSEMAYCLVNYGYVVVGEFMHDAYGYGPSEVKQNIIGIMATFIANAANKAAAIEHLHTAWASTERNSAIESSLWDDWKDACKDFMSIAEQQAHKQGDNNV